MERSKKRERVVVTKEEVIAKLKDDGDFDNLRLKIIHKLKDDEDLRNSIISIVRQSSAINRPGAENMKLRQLSDAIYDEVGSEMMSKVSNGVWEIIRSADGMKYEIKETVQSVYDKLLEPPKKGKCETDREVTVKASTVAVDGNSSDDDLQEPPGFPLPSNHQSNPEAKEELQFPMHCQGNVDEEKDRPRHSKDAVESNNVSSSALPGFSAEPKQSCDDSDEDPDVPPGFG